MNKSGKTFQKIGLYSAMSLFALYSLSAANESNKGLKERVIVDLIQQKNGCADCHKGMIKTPDGKEKDISLAGEVKIIPRHPQVDVKATIKDCMKCHGAGERRIRFINGIHDVHLNSPIYVGEFKQTCSGCHDMKHIKGL
jgi:cytochrome c peroxidase